MPETRIVGESKLEVSRLGFGAWAIGGAHYAPVERGRAVETIEAHLEAGGSFFDAARAADVGLVARTVIESGLLTGKYPPGTTFDENDLCSPRVA